MKNLTQFVEVVNQRRALFGEEPVTADNKWLLVDMVYDMLSPENLFADGERSHEDAMARKADLENIRLEILGQGE
jgi:hypothetical protein